MTDNSQIQLPDGRALGYAEYGNLQGEPVVFLAGAPNSRFMHPPTEPTEALGARLIVLERPGFGLSDFQPRRTLLDWPDDVAAAADALGIDRFPLAGISAGAPYAAACAYKIPQRLTRVAIISGVGPMTVPGAMEEMPRVRQLGAKLAGSVPWLVWPLLWLISDPHRDPERFYAHMLSGNSDADRALLSRPETKAMLLRHYLEATRAGMRGFARDSIIVSNPWGFTPADISVPVYLWHGEDDANVSLSAARYLAQAIPNCQAKFISGEGHWLILKYWEGILSELLA
jgi:pimeloyl-ACP methyl ester carboxylesterase